MSNMSYCKFENTLSDLRQCYYKDNGFQPVKDCDIEEQARLKLIELCKKIANEYKEGE